MYASIFYVLTYANLINAPLFVWHIFVGPLWTIFAYHYYIVHVSIFTMSVLILTETFVIRVMAEKVWKRMPPVQDDFFCFFLWIMNCLVTLFVAGKYYAAGQWGALIYRLTGRSTWLFPKPIVKMYTAEIILVLGFLSLVGHGLLVGEKAIKKKFRKPNSVGPAILQLAAPVVPEVNRQQHPHFNNQLKNDEVITGPVQAVLVTVGLTITFPGTMTYFIQGWKKIERSDLEMALLDINTFCALTLAVPLILYARNSDLRKHLINLLRDFFESHCMW